MCAVSRARADSSPLPQAFRRFVVSAERAWIDGPFSRGHQKIYKKRGRFWGATADCNGGRRTKSHHDLLQKAGRHMKHTATVALMLNLGVASVYAQQAPLTFSGTAESSPVVLQNGVSTTEYNFAGHGRLGAFTFRTLSASAPSQPPPSSGCALYGSVVAGGGVFRFEDGSLFILASASGTD